MFLMPIPFPSNFKKSERKIVTSCEEELKKVKEENEILVEQTKNWKKEYDSVQQERIDADKLVIEYADENAELKEKLKTVSALFREEIERSNFTPTKYDCEIRNLNALVERLKKENNELWDFIIFRRRTL